MQQVYEMITKDKVISFHNIQKWNIWGVFSLGKEKASCEPRFYCSPPTPPCSRHQLPRPDLGGETLTYPQIWEWREKGVGSDLRLSETTKTARLLITASHPLEHVISFIPWSAVSSHHLYNYTERLPSVGRTAHLQQPCANTIQTKQFDWDHHH